MQVHFINLERSPERRERFLETNAGSAEFIRAEAVDGKVITYDELHAQGIVAEPLRAFKPRALGSATSHKRLWDQCIESNESITVAEDDALFNRNFARRASEVLARLPEDWDIIRWGWNFDSILTIEWLPGLRRGFTQFERKPLGEQTAVFQEADFDVLPMRLLQAFGIVCYTLSPKGAAALCERCFPLKNQALRIPTLKRKMLTYCLDTTMNMHYHKLKAYVCCPPLVWSDNIKGQS